ncbi:hypothetical protein Aperf_G00000095829 [Anoplocephala perfoliata]
MFFAYFAHWQWPTPVTISSIYTSRELKLYSWEPRQMPQEAMPIITPVYPHQNAAYLVRPSTLEMVVGELKRGVEILEQIDRGAASWEDLFQPYDIVRDYKYTQIYFHSMHIYQDALLKNATYCRHFVKFELTVDTFEELRRIGGLIDSRLRELAALLEGNRVIQAVRISTYNKPKNLNASRDLIRELNGNGDGVKTTFECAWLLGMKINRVDLMRNGAITEQVVDITSYIQQFYLNLQDRESRVNFIKILKPSYIKQ